MAREPGTRFHGAWAALTEVGFATETTGAAVAASRAHRRRTH
jgi:hypothetical protein